MWDCVLPACCFLALFLAPPTTAVLWNSDNCNNVGGSLAVVLALVLAPSASAVLWNSENCNNVGGSLAVAGTVTDAICCNVTTTGSECDELGRGECDNRGRCHWYGDTCKLNRDQVNNVCCHEDVNDVCGDLLKGKCPKKFQVSHNCCPGLSGFKYTGILEVENDTMTCCNTPCSSLDQAYAENKSECTIEIQDKPHCAPGDRGYMRFFQPMGGRGMPGMMGGLAGMGAGLGSGMGAAMGGPGGGMFNAGALQALLGFGGGAGGRKMGNVVQGFGNQGLPGTLGMAALKEAGEGQSKEAHVDEITVDDLMLSLIDALDTDKDVFDYEKEVTSDPWFRKQSHGGIKNSFSFIDPWMFLDQIHGSPFGMSNAQMSYGKMYGIPQSSFKSPKFGGIGGQGGRGGMGGMGMGGLGGGMGGAMGGMQGNMGGNGMRGSRGASQYIPVGMGGPRGMSLHGMMGGMGMHGQAMSGMGMHGQHGGGMGMHGQHGGSMGMHGQHGGAYGGHQQFGGMGGYGSQGGAMGGSQSQFGFHQQQGGFAQGPQPNQGGFPPQGPAPNQGGFPPQGVATQQGQSPQQGFPPQGGFASQQGHPPQQGGFPPQHGFPPQQQQGGFPQQTGSFPPQQPGGFPPRQQGSFPSQQPGGFPPQQQQGGFPPQHQQGGFPPQQSGLPPQQGLPPPQQQGGFPPQASSLAKSADLASSGNSQSETPASNGS